MAKETISQKLGDIARRAGVLERQLVNKLFTHTDLIPYVRTKVNPDSIRVCRKYYDLVVDAYIEKKDITLLASERGIHFSDFIEESWRPIDDIINEFIENDAARRIIEVLYRSITNVPTSGVSQFVADVQKNIITGVSLPKTESTDIGSIIQTFRERQEFYIDKFKGGKGIVGIPTGYDKIDNVIDGLRPEHLWVIGGYTNTGKTAASLNIVASLINQGKRPVYYSLEMGKVDILTRLIGIMTAQSGMSVIKGYKHDEDAVSSSLKTIEKSHMSIHNNTYDLSEIEFSMQEESIRQPVDLFVVDFIQLITVKESSSEYETMTKTILGLQQAAKRLKTPIIVLSQISNEGARNANDVVMSFKGSGAIAAAADLAIEISIGEEDKTEWKRKMFEGEDVYMKWNIRKNRHGQVGFVDMLFSGRTGIFKQYNVPNL